MALTRRELLGVGGASAMAALLPSFRASRPLTSSGNASPPIDQRYLMHGLNLLCNAHASDSFATGHAGGAVISAFYLCRDEELEPGTEEVIKSALDEHYAVTPGPFPEEKPVEDGIPTLLKSLEAGIDQLWRDGHNVIFLALALRALHDLPQAVTPSRIDGLRRTLIALEPRISGKGDIRIPESMSAFAEFVLEEFLGSTEGGPGQGYSGHLLTYGRAIADLRMLGHERFAEKCLNAFQLAVKTARPSSPGEGYRAERPEVAFLHPDSKKYWQRRASAGTMELGHLFKYPYAFLGLQRLSKNQELNEVCTDNCYRLFRS